MDNRTSPMHGRIARPRYGYTLAVECPILRSRRGSGVGVLATWMSNAVKKMQTSVTLMPNWLAFLDSLIAV